MQYKAVAINTLAFEQHCVQQLLNSCVRNGVCTAKSLVFPTYFNSHPGIRVNFYGANLWTKFMLTVNSRFEIILLVLIWRHK